VHGCCRIYLVGPHSDPDEVFRRRAERRLVGCSAYLPYDSEGPPPSREMEQLVLYCKKENLRLIVGCDSNAHHTAWAAPTALGEVVPA